MNHREAENLRLDPENWRLGVIYVCREDPRVIVRNRWLFGWTWNFGNPGTAVVLPIIVITFLVPLVLYQFFYMLRLQGLIIVFVFLLLSHMLLADYLHRGPR